MRQTLTSMKELIARYRAILIKCLLIYAALFSGATGVRATETLNDGTNTYIGTFGIPLTIYDNDASTGTFYSFFWASIANAEISDETAVLNNNSRVGSFNLSETKTGAHTEVSALTDSQTAVNNIITVLTNMNKGAKDFNALPDGIKEALNVLNYSGGQTVKEFLLEDHHWGDGSRTALSNEEIGVIRSALNNDYAGFNDHFSIPQEWDATVSITGSTLTLNGTSAIVNRAKVAPGTISINNSTVIANGMNALAAHSGLTTNISFTGSSLLQVNNGATLTITSSGNRVSLANSNLTLNGTIAGNVSLSGTVVLQGTGTIGGNLDTAASSVLNMKNGAIDAITAGTVTGGNFSVALDVDAAGNRIDHFTANSFTTGTVTIDDLNFLSAQKNFTLTVLDGTATDAMLVLSSAISTAYNGTTDIVETENNLSAAANWETAFAQTEYTSNVTRSLAVQNNKTLAFTITENSKTPVSVTPLGDTIKALNTMSETTRTMTNSTSLASYTATDDFGETAEGTFTINGAKADSSAATINMNAHTGFSVASEAALRLQNIVFSGNTAADGSVLTVAGGAASLLNVTIGNAVSVTSGSLTLSGGNSLGGLINAGTVSLTGNNTVGAMSGAGTLTNNGNLTLTGTTNAQIIGGTGRTYINAVLTTTTAINQAITVNSGKMLMANADKIGGAVTNNGTLSLTGGTLGQVVTGGAVQINGGVTSNVSLSGTTVTISGEKQLTISADNVGANLTNNGTLVLTGGTLANALSGTGAVQIDGNVTSNVTLSNTTITSGNTLTIGAGNVGTELTNGGTLVLTNGTLSNALSGGGAVQIAGNVISNVDLGHVTINSGKKLTINAGYVDNTFTNDGGILALSGGTLGTAVPGTIHIDGTVASDVSLANATINGGKQLTIGAGKVGAGLVNNGTLVLNAGTLENTVSGTGTVQINSNVISDVSLSNTIVTTGNKLTISANDIGVNLTNNGILALSGGTLSKALSGTGNVHIDGTVSSDVLLSNATINENKQLTINAGKIGASLTNNGGTLVLTGGTLGNALSGIGGAVRINGSVTSNVLLSNVTITSGSRLAINAGNVGTGLTNNGVLVLRSGTLTNDVSGTIQISGNVISSDVSLSNTVISMGSSLTIGAGNVGNGITNYGTLALSSGTLTKNISGEGEIQITGDVISEVLLSRTRITSGNTLTIGAEKIGDYLINYGTLALSGGTLARTISGTVRIDGNVLSNVSLSNATITSGNTLTIGAGKVGTGMINNGTLVLTGGTLANALSGTGAVQIDGNVTSNVTLSNTTITLGNTLTIGAGNVGTGLTNGGTLVLTNGTLSNALSGAGAVQIAGNVVSSVDLANVTIDENKRLTINADYVDDGEFTNNGILALSGGTLDTVVAGTGSIWINGDVVSNVALSNAMICNEKTLTIGADNVGANLTNNGTIVLTDGTLSNAFSGAGAIQINGDVTSTVPLSNTTINATKQLTIDAGNVGTGFENNGSLVLKDGRLSNALSGAGTLRIAGNVVSDTALSNVTVNADKTLTLSANYVGSGFTNNGTVALTGGAISNPLSGNVAVTGFVEMKGGADFGGAQIDMTEGILDIGENTLTSDTLRGGAVWLDLKEYAVAETLVTTTPSDTVTLEVFPLNVTNKAVQHYTLTSTNAGYDLDLVLAPFFAVSTTPFDKSQAMDIGPFDESSWHGGDLYVVALNVAEIAVSELVKNGYTVTANEKNTTKKLADDLENVLTGEYRENYEKVNLELIYGFFFEDYERVKTVLNETGTEATPATAQTAGANAQAVMSVVASRLDGVGATSSIKGRSGGDFIAGNSAIWAQGMYNKAKLSGTEGFNSDSSGFAAGYEYNIDDSYKVGAGYAFASTDIKTKRSKTSVDTHTVFVYGSYKPDAFYVNGALSYGRSEYDEKTRVLGLKSDYKADAISVQAMSGYAFDFFAPEAGLRYTNVKEKAYTDALGARISDKNVQTLTAVAGVKTEKEFRFEKEMFFAQAAAALTYDLKQENADKTVALANGTSYVVQGTNMKRFGLEIGAGFSYKLNGKTDINLSYEGKFKNHYTDHTGMLSIKYGF